MSTLTLGRRSLLKATAATAALAATASALSFDAASATTTSTARTVAEATKVIDSYHRTKNLNLGSKVGGLQTITHTPYPNSVTIIGYLQNYTGGYIFAEHPDHTFHLGDNRFKPAGIGYVRKGTGIDALIRDYNAKVKHPYQKLYPVSAEYSVESRVIAQELRIGYTTYPDNTQFYAYANWFTNTGNGLLMTDQLTARTILHERYANSIYNDMRPVDNPYIMPDMRFFKTRQPQKDELTTLGAKHIHNTLTSGIDNGQFHMLTNREMSRSGYNPYGGIGGYVRVGGLFSRHICSTLKNTTQYRDVEFTPDLSRGLRHQGAKTSYFGYTGVTTRSLHTFFGLIYVEKSDRMFTVSDGTLFATLRSQGQRPISDEIKKADGSISINTEHGTYTVKDGKVTFTSA